MNIECTLYSCIWSIHVVGTINIRNAEKWKRWLIILIFFSTIRCRWNICAVPTFSRCLFYCFVSFSSGNANIVLFIHFSYSRANECHAIHATQRFTSAIWAIMHAKMSSKTRSATTAHCEVFGSQEIRRDLVNIHFNWCPCRKYF